VSVGWFFVLAGVAALVTGLGMAAVVLWVGRQSEEKRRA
jgi:hypothetical protein